MSKPAERTATYDDLCRVPENLVAQIIHGQLITQPRPGPKHTYAASSLGGELDGPFHKGRYGGPGGWWILDEPELHLGPHVLVPGLAGWRTDRLPTLPATAYFQLPPDCVCEVLSPSTAQIDRIDKLGIYATNHIPHAWLVDPDARTLEIFSLEDGHWRLDLALKEADEVRAPPFDAIQFNLSLLWA